MTDPQLRCMVLTDDQNIFVCLLSELGDIFGSIGVRELQPNANEAFSIFSTAHRLVYSNRFTKLLFSAISGNVGIVVIQIKNKYCMYKVEI